MKDFMPSTPEYYAGEWPTYRSGTMKHATFKDFVREAYYHGIDLVVEAPKVNENVGDAQNIMRVVQALISASRFDRTKLDEAEKLLADNFTKLVIRGVVTYWPTEIQRRDAADRTHRGLPD